MLAYRIVTTQPTGWDGTAESKGEIIDGGLEDCLEGNCQSKEGR